jgi:hypothetical protein
MFGPFEDTLRAMNNNVTLAGLDEVVFDGLQPIADRRLMFGREHVAHFHFSIAPGGVGKR